MDHEDDQPEEKVLKGDDAIALWLQGREKWNAWVEDHQDWGVDLSRVDFSQLVEPYDPTTTDGRVDFSEFNFPNGEVSFHCAQLGNGIADFEGAQFGEGSVIFNEVQFGDDDVYFDDVQFGGGSVSFSHAHFGNGDVTFTNARFGKGEVRFSETEFGEGDVNFWGAQFGEGDVRFNHAQVGDGDVIFRETYFGNGNIFFDETHFGDGRVIFKKSRFDGSFVSFDGARFGMGTVDFSDAEFGEADVIFSFTEFGEGEVYFYNAQFGSGEVIFTGAKFGLGIFSMRAANLSRVKIISFRLATWKSSVLFYPKIGSKTGKIDFSSASIGGELSLGTFTTSCVIDLRHTKLNHPIDLDRVDINYRTKKHPRRLFWLRYLVALNQNTSTCFRRLKKLAKDADDHERALDFYAKEMRSSYGRELKGWPLFLYLVYDKVSDYGRSLLIPTTLLCAMIVMYGLVYFQISSWQNIGSFAGLGSMDRAVNVVNHFGSALTFSLAHALPFYFGSREANSDTMDTLFSANPPDYLHWLTISQGMVCSVLLFLIALALRNRFRS